MNIALVILLFLGSAVIQFFIGGMRPVFAIPGYVLLAVAGLLSVFQIARTRPLPSAACLVTSLIFFGYIVGRSLTSPVEYLARPDRFMVLACLIVYLCVALYLTSPKARFWLLGGLFVLAVGHFAVGAIQFTQGNNFLPFDYIRADYGRRASGFYVCPNHFAGLLEMLGVMAAALLLWSRAGIKSRMLLFYFSGMAIAGIAISGSRGGYLSLGCAFVALLILSLIAARRVYPDHFITILCGSILVFGIVTAGAFVVMKKDSMLTSRLNALVDTQNMRRQLWDAAIRQYQQQPDIGTGSGTYLYLGRLYRDPSVDYDPVWVHGDYLHLLAEYGIAGAATFLLFLGAHLWNGLRAFSILLRKRLVESNLRTSNALAMVAGALAAVVAMMAHSVVDFNLHIPGNALVLAAFFGILANPPLSRHVSSTALPWQALPFRLAIPVIAAGLLADAAPHLPGEWYAEKARVALRDGQYLRTIRESQRGLERDTANPNLYYYLGEARRLLGNGMSNPIARKKMNEAAIRAFDDSIRLFPQDEKLWVKKSQALDIMGLHDAALEHLDEARKLDPLLPSLNTYYGAHYQLLGEHEKAVTYYNLSRGHELARAGKDDLLRQIKEDAGH